MAPPNDIGGVRKPSPEQEANSEALREAVVEAIVTVEERMNKPQEIVADQAGKIGFWAAIKEAVSPHVKEQFRLMWKDLKAVTAGGIALAPVLGELGSGAIVTQELIDAAVLEGATLAQAETLVHGANVFPGGVVAETAGRMISKDVLEGLNKSLKVVDPFEDVPKVITFASGGLEMLGLHGALAIPAVIQMMRNRFNAMKESTGMIKDVGKVVVDEVKNRIERTRQQEMEAASTAFA